MGIDAKKATLTIALFSIVYGAWYLLKEIVHVYLFLRMGYDPSGPWSLKTHLLMLSLTLVVSVLIPLLRIMGGFLLLKLKRLGRRLIIGVSLFDFVFGILVALNMVYHSFNPVPIPETGPNAVVLTISNWPLYIFACIGLVAIYILTRGNVKESLHG